MRPSDNTPDAAKSHWLPRRDHRPSPKPPRESKNQERICCCDGSHPTIWVMFMGLSFFKWMVCSMMRKFWFLSHLQDISTGVFLPSLVQSPMSHSSCLRLS